MKKHPGKALANMVLSCVLCSIAVNWVALPNGFVVTGITGLSMTAAQFTGVNYALIYYGLALAILLCTALTLGWREVSNILVLSPALPGGALGAEPHPGGDHPSGKAHCGHALRRDLRSGLRSHLPPGLLLRRNGHSGQAAGNSACSGRFR